MRDLPWGTRAWLGSLLAVCLLLAVIRGATYPPNPLLHMEHIYLQKIASLIESLAAAAAVLWLPIPLESCDTSGNASSQRDSSLGHSPGAAFLLSGLQRGSQFLQSVKQPARMYLTARIKSLECVHRIISETPLHSTRCDPTPAQRQPRAQALRGANCHVWDHCSNEEQKNCTWEKMVHQTQNRLSDLFLFLT